MQTVRRNSHCSVLDHAWQCKSTPPLILPFRTDHLQGNFLAWHRYYIWAYEQALRNECGYKGYQPYYNWAWWAEDPSKSPLFDGSETSISGDGSYVEREAICIPRPDRCFVTLQPGNGGGCVTSGPMKEYVPHRFLRSCG
jgi:tyrosinase